MSKDIKWNKGRAEKSMKEVKSWLVNINSCPYYVKAARAISAITSALQQFHLDHPKNPLTDLDIYCHLLTPEEEERCKKFPRKD